MGQTIAEKILGRVARSGGRVHAGAEIEAKPDFVMAYDFPGYLDVWFRQMASGDRREEMEEGFPQIACPGIVAAVSRWDALAIDFAASLVHNRTTGRSLPFEPFSPAQMLMLEAGGLNGYLHLRPPG